MQSVGKGAIQSPEDYRYVKLEHLAGAAPEASSFPASFHIDFSQVPDIYQRQIGECTNAGFAEIRMHREIRLNSQNLTFSERFTYALSKMRDGLADKANQGTFPNMPFKIGVAYGIPTVATCAADTTLDFESYIFNRTAPSIPTAAYTEADKYRIPGYAQIGGFNAVSEAQLKQGLTQSQDGVAICLQIGNEWWTAKDGRTSWASADILPIRKSVAPVSGHVVTATGWETEAGTNRCKLFFRNHWSKGWADNDNGWFYLDEHPLSEAWMISEIPDALLAIVKSLPAQKDFSYTWANVMNPGDNNADVQNLQIALKIAGAFPFNQPVTQYFGNITRAAVMQFQTTYGVASAAEIQSANGKVGPKTLDALNKMFGHK